MGRRGGEGVEIPPVVLQLVRVDALLPSFSEESGEDAQRAKPSVIHANKKRLVFFKYIHVTC